MKEESTWASPSPIWCWKWFEYGCVCGAWLVNCNSKRRYFERLFITSAFNLRVHTFKLVSIFGGYSIMRVRCCELTNAGRERERKMVGVKWRISSIIYIRYIIRFVCCNMLQHEKDECMTSLILWRARFAITNDTLSGAKRERERKVDNAIIVIGSMSICLAWNHNDSSKILVWNVNLYAFLMLPLVTACCRYSLDCRNWFGYFFLLIAHSKSNLMAMILRVHHTPFPMYGFI